MVSPQFQSYLSIFLLSLSFCLQSRNREDFLQLYQKSSSHKSNPELMRTLTLEPSFEEATQKVTYCFSIKSAVINKNFSWRAYYKGKIIPQTEGIFQFQADKNITTFALVIAMIKKPAQATIEGLEVPEKVDYIYYQLERATLLSNTKKYSWKIKKTVGNKGLAIAQDALIILLDPSYVKALNIHTWETESDVVMLPTIVLTDDTTLHDASIKTVLAALDTDLLHSRSEIEQTQTDNVLISRMKEL